ncbi:YfcC family protein [Aegicerativicinus sediminis]
MKLQFPHPFAILLIFIGIAVGLTYLLPAGKYERIIDPNTSREIVVPNSYKSIPNEPIGFFDAVVKVPEGIIFGADIVILILLIGGAFVVVDKTGAFDNGISALIHRFSNSPQKVMILLGLIFALLGALNNTYEEIIALIPIMIALTSRIGFTKISAVAISAGSATIGATFSPINPFGALLAQKIADVQPFSGFVFRIIILLIATGFWIYWILRVGKSKSEVTEETAMGAEKIKLSKRTGIILTIVGLTFTTMVYGILNWDWDYNQMSALFLIMGIICGFIGKLGFNGTFKAYAFGIQEMAFAALIVGLARSVYLVLYEGLIIDSIVYYLFNPLKELPVAFSAIAMTLSQSVLHVPIPSNSGQAVLTIPILTPLADLIGMSRQVMILCYQYGAIIMDLITPTNGALLAMLTAAKLSYKDWFLYCLKPLGIILSMSIIAILIAILINF